MNRFWGFSLCQLLFPDQASLKEQSRNVGNNKNNIENSSRRFSETFRGLISWQSPKKLMSPSWVDIKILLPGHQCHYLHCPLVASVVAIIWWWLSPNILLWLKLFSVRCEEKPHWIIGTTVIGLHFSGGIWDRFPHTKWEDSWSAQLRIKLVLSHIAPCCRELWGVRVPFSLRWSLDTQIYWYGVIPVLESWSWRRVTGHLKASISIFS